MAFPDDSRSPAVPPDRVSAQDICAALISDRMEKPGRKGPLVVGICGSQGSGKSTLADALVGRFDHAVNLSIDDIYHTRAQRAAHARQVHPLLATRGVPGTHDVALGLDVLAALDRGEAVALPRFDKAADDRCAVNSWPVAPAASKLVIVEGWCVGALPQPDAALLEPVNDLERLEDPDGRWRAFVNTALAGIYQTLFARLDVLILLAAPGFDTVLGWRLQQEADLRARSSPGAPGVMDDAQVARFIAHYERITRWVLSEMPARADAVLRLDAARQLIAVERCS